MAFQRDGIKFALAQKGRCLIGDDMGESWTTDWGCPALRELSLPTHISQRSRPQLDGQCCVRAPKRRRKRRHPPQLPLTDIVGHGLALPLTHSLTHSLPPARLSSAGTTTTTTTTTTTIVVAAAAHIPTFFSSAGTTYSIITGLGKTVQAITIMCVAPPQVATPTTWL